MPVRLVDVERWLGDLYIAAEAASLRREDRCKARQVAAILDEIERAMARISHRHALVLVDAAAGKSYVGLLAAKLVIEPQGRTGHVVAIERDPARVAASERALERLGSTTAVDFRTGQVGDDRLWPDRPSIVVALHACGEAADAIIGQAVARRARSLLLVPCCTSRAVAAAVAAVRQAERLGIPRQAPVRRRFVQAMVDAARTQRLEAAGYETEVIEFVGATVTPHNLLWRSRLVEEPTRMAAARDGCRLLQETGGRPEAGEVLACPREAADNH